MSTLVPKPSFCQEQLPAKDRGETTKIRLGKAQEMRGGGGEKANKLVEIREYPKKTLQIHGGKKEKVSFKRKLKIVRKKKDE